MHTYFNGDDMQTDTVMLDVAEAQATLSAFLTEGDLTYLALEDFQRQWRKLGDESALFPSNVAYQDGSFMAFDEDEAITRWESCLELACAAEQHLLASFDHLFSTFRDFSRFLQDRA